VKNGRGCEKGPFAQPASARSLSVNLPASAQDIVIPRVEVRDGMTSQTSWRRTNVSECFFSNDCEWLAVAYIDPQASGARMLGKSKKSHCRIDEGCCVIGVHAYPARLSRQNIPTSVAANLCHRTLSDPTAWHACLIGASRTAIVVITIRACLAEVVLLPRPGHTRAREMQSNRMSRMGCAVPESALRVWEYERGKTA
jgi:hypothetical protein